MVEISFKYGEKKVLLMVIRKVKFMRTVNMNINFKSSCVEQRT